MVGTEVYCNVGFTCPVILPFVVYTCTEWKLEGLLHVHVILPFALTLIIHYYRAVDGIDLASFISFPCEMRHNGAMVFS